VATLPDDEYLVAASDLRIDVITMLNDSLIPAAKKRAIDLAEKLKAEAQAKINEQEKANELHLVEIPNATVNVIVRSNAAMPAIIVPQASDDAELDEVATVSADYATVEQCERVVNENIIAMYAALNPVLHAKVIEAAGKVMEFQNTPQNSRSSFLHNLFDSDKQGKALRAAFCLIIK
jgi:hypothetical protein